MRMWSEEGKLHFSTRALGENMSLSSTIGSIHSKIQPHVGILSFYLQHNLMLTEPKEIEFSIPLGTVEAGDFNVEKCLMTYADSEALDSTVIKDHLKSMSFDVQSNVSEKKAVISGTIPAVGKSRKVVRCFYKYSNDFQLTPSNDTSVEVKEGEDTHRLDFTSQFTRKSLYKNQYLSKADGSAFRAMVTDLQAAKFQGVTLDLYVLPTDELALMGTTFDKKVECTFTATIVTKNGNQEKTENVDSTIEVSYEGSAKLGTRITWDYEVADETEITGVEIFCPDLKFQSHSDFLGTVGEFFIKGATIETYDYVKTSGVTASGLAVVVGLAAAGLAFFM